MARRSWYRTLLCPLYRGDKHDGIEETDSGIEKPKPEIRYDYSITYDPKQISYLRYSLTVYGNGRPVHKGGDESMSNAHDSAQGMIDRLREIDAGPKVMYDSRNE